MVGNSFTCLSRFLRTPRHIHTGMAGVHTQNAWTIIQHTRSIRACPNYFHFTAEQMCYHKGPKRMHKRLGKATGRFRSGNGVQLQAKRKVRVSCRITDRQTFNQRVVGSIPTALTNEIRDLVREKHSGLVPVMPLSDHFVTN
jgi:hypothetical protein